MDSKKQFNKKCFACKQNITINRNKKNNIIYFDKQYYHIECFENMNYLKKICYCCNKNNREIIIHNESDINGCIFFDNHYYHQECFIRMCKEKNTKKWNTALDNISVLKKNTNLKLKELLKKKIEKYGTFDQLEQDAQKMIDKYFEESDVNMFIKYTYDITQIDNSIWRKLCKIYNGELQGMENGIPPQHLLDMWGRKLNYLNKIASQNIVKGKDMTKTQRVLYDLSVLANKYDSYLEWLNKQRILECEKNISTDIMQSVNIENLENNYRNNSNDDDMEDILNEIFG